MLKKILGLIILTIGLIGIAGVVYELYLLGLRKSHFTDKNYLKSQGLDIYLIKSFFGWAALYIVAFGFTPTGIQMLSSKKNKSEKFWLFNFKKRY